MDETAPPEEAKKKRKRNSKRLSSKYGARDAGVKKIDASFLKDKIHRQDDQKKILVLLLS